MMPSIILLVVVLVLIFSFTLTNGFLDGGGIVSTVITTRVMEPLPALVMVACCEVLGVSLLGHAVVNTIGLHMIHFPVSATSLEVLAVLFAAMSAAVAWNAAMWHFSWPTSSSHALLGGLVGAVWARFGETAIAWPIVIKVLVGLAVVPFGGALVGLGLSKIVYWAGQYLTPGVTGTLRALQIIVLAGVALVHGSNDGQKSMAFLLMAFVAFGWGGLAAQIPAWLGLSCGLALGLGVVFGSRRTMQTVGQGLYRVHSLQGLCAESATMLLVGASSVYGIPMSTSQVMSSAVLGAGAAVRPKSVRWDLAGTIGLAWLSTIPAAATLAAILSYVVSKAL